MQHGVLDLSKVWFKPFVSFISYTYMKSSVELELFTNIPIDFQKQFHSKTIGNTNSHFIKFQTKEYLGHDQYKQKYKTTKSVTILLYSKRKISMAQSQIRTYFNLLEKSYNPCDTPYSKQTKHIIFSEKYAGAPNAGHQQTVDYQTDRHAYPSMRSKTPKISAQEIQLSRD